MNLVQAFTRDAMAKAGLASSKSTLVTTVVSDLVRSIRDWSGEGEGWLVVAEGTTGIEVQLTWEGDMTVEPDWLSCSDIRWPTLFQVLKGIELWHEPPNKAGVLFVVQPSAGGLVWPSRSPDKA